jgi:Pyruvate/2-oxoacid:ferredoxin oxidoreductase delta subunit
MRPSSRKFFNEAQKLPGFSILDRLHGYVYARWPYTYIGIGRGKYPSINRLAPLWMGIARILPKKEPPENGSGTYADGYHGKVIPARTAKQLLSIQQDVQIDDLEQVIPYPRARSIILQNPDSIIALECPCRAVVENPCTPLDVCLVIGEPFASFIADHQPDRSRRISQDEAIQIIEAEQAKGHVAHAFFKDAMLDRFYAICNCCECCCGAIHAHHHGTPMLTSSGYLCEIDQEACIGCETCVEVCQFGAVQMVEDLAAIEYEKCMGCGVCVDHCSQEALALVLDSQKGQPLEITNLIQAHEEAKV